MPSSTIHSAENKEEQCVTFSMGIDQSMPFKLKKGFSGAEKTHRWTEGTHAIVNVPAKEGGRHITKIIFETAGMGMVSASHSQELFVSGKGIETRRYIYDSANPRQDICVNLPSHLNEEINIHFFMENACRPEIIIPTNHDPRILAIAFTYARVYTDITHINECVATVKEKIKYGLKIFDNTVGTNPPPCNAALELPSTSIKSSMTPGSF